MLNNVLKKNIFLYGAPPFFLLVFTAFLMFGPYKIPILSNFRNSLLGVEKTDNKKIIEEEILPTEKVVLVEDVSEELDQELEEDEQISPTNPVKVEKKVENQNTVTPSIIEPTNPTEAAPLPQPTPPKCTDEKIATLQDNINSVSRSKQYVDSYVVNVGGNGDMGTSVTIWGDLRNANLYTNTKISQLMNYYGNLLSQVSQEGGASGAWRTGTFYRQLADIQNEWLRELSKEFGNELNKLNSSLYDCKM